MSVFFRIVRLSLLLYRWLNVFQHLNDNLGNHYYEEATLLAIKLVLLSTLVWAKRTEIRECLVCVYRGACQVAKRVLVGLNRFKLRKQKGSDRIDRKN